MPLRVPRDRFDRTAPVIFSPADPRVLFFASQVVWKTGNGGASWEAISPDLTRESPGTPASLGRLADNDPERGKHRGVVYALAPSPKDVNLLWAGTDDGVIQVTRDGGRTWQNVTPPEITPWSKVTQLDASHFDAATVYASVSRFRLDDLKPYIYRTHDGGKTWQKIVNGLPENASVNAVREDPERRGLLFAATERQVWVSFDDGDRWQIERKLVEKLHDGVPAVPLYFGGDSFSLAPRVHGFSWSPIGTVPPKCRYSTFTLRWPAPSSTLDSWREYQSCR